MICNCDQRLESNKTGITALNIICNLSFEKNPDTIRVDNANKLQPLLFSTSKTDMPFSKRVVIGPKASLADERICRCRQT
jgi:hypothetical protein